MWSQLSHPNILSFYGIVDILDDTYLISPWVRYGDLAKFVPARMRYLEMSEDQRTLEADSAAFEQYDEYQMVSGRDVAVSSFIDLTRYCYQVQGMISGITYLHSLNIIHGDIKCANVLLDQELIPIFCDFGMTKIRDGYSTTSTAMKGAGSVQWMSPELLENMPKTTESDVYALGLTICEVCLIMTWTWRSS